MCKEHNQPYEIDCHLCMIVDARVLPSGTTLYSTSATDKSPVRARHTPTNRTTETTRQVQRCTLTLTRAKVGAPHILMNSYSSSSGLPNEPQARQSSTPSSPPGAQANISPRSASALPCKPERIHQPGTRTCPGSTRQLHQRSVRTLASPYFHQCRRR